MIKSGLKSNSQSNGRELEYTILSLQNESVQNEFSKLITKILENKLLKPNSPNGLKRFNILFETYIKKVYKEYKTVNIYARQLNSENFLVFWDKLTRLVKANPNIFQGRLEPHPADREINSWHIQYTGANAKYIEKILAAFVVKEGAESSMDMALGIDAKAYFETTDKLEDVKYVNNELFVQELVNKQQKVFIDSDLKEASSIIKTIRSTIKKVVKISTSSLRDRLDKIKANLKITNKQQILLDIKNKRSNKVKSIIQKIKKQRGN